MSRFKNLVILSLGFLILTGLLILSGPLVARSQGASPSKDVVVTNTTSNPVPTQAVGTTVVQDIDNGARQPFQEGVQVTLDPGFAGQNGFVPVPTGKRLVIEYASARGSVPAGQTMVFTIVTQLSGELSGKFHTLPATQQFTSASTDSFITGQQVRLYADSGTTVFLRADRNSAAGTGSFLFTISGYLINVP